MSTFSTILAAILGIVFVASGIPKLTGQEAVAANFARWGYADVVRTATGWLEVLTGALLLAGIAVQALAVTGTMLVIFIMIGALFTHQRAHDPLKLWVPAAVLLVLDLVLAYSLLP
jgi:putative oxidoreductase